jgi:hypothetical protein
MQLPRYINNKEILQGDIAVFSYILSFGRMHYFEDIMSVYRKHIGGVSNSFKHKDSLRNKDSKIFIYNQLNVVTNFRFNNFIKCNIAIENQIYLMYTTSNFRLHRYKYWILKIYYRILLFFI